MGFLGKGEWGMAARVDHDQIFKRLFTEFFREFMELFLPKQAAGIDFRRVTFLDKEHFTDTQRGRHKRLDLVARVGLKGGGEEYVLVHTEFESRRKGDFPRRMFEYCSQLYLRYGKPVIPVAVFSDQAVWRKRVSDEFRMGFQAETYIRFRYHLIKLRDYNHRDFLERENPIGFALMARSGYDRRQRVRLKADFLRLITGSRVNPARRSLLVEFVESYMLLDRQEQQRFDKLIEREAKYREVKKMVTIYEKRGIKKGIEKGIEKGAEKARRDLAGKLLAEGMPAGKVAQLTGLSVSVVRRLKKR